MLRQESSSTLASAALIGDFNLGTSIFAPQSKAAGVNLPRVSIKQAEPGSSLLKMTPSEAELRKASQVMAYFSTRNENIKPIISLSRHAVHEAAVATSRRSKNQAPKTTNLRSKDKLAPLHSRPMLRLKKPG